MYKRLTLQHYWKAANHLPELITPAEYAKLKHYHVHTVQRYARRGQIEGLKVNGRWYVFPPIDP